MRATRVAPEDRAAYHAAGAIAANFLVALEALRGAARRHRRRRPARSSRRSSSPPSSSGPSSAPSAALTGPIARGDEGTVARQRAAIAERTPELLPLWTELAEVDPRRGG